MRRVLLALVLTLLPAAPASALELGVQDDAVLIAHAYSDPEMALDRAAAMGVDRVRTNLVWADAMPRAQAEATAQPERVDWDFGALERLYAQATARGMKLQVTLTGPAPAWATGDGAISFNRPSGPRFAEFAAAAAARFKGRIDRWSIWNEPNWYRFLTPYKSAPGLYRDLYRRGDAAIRAMAPGATVLFGELMPGANVTRSTPALRFLRAATCSTKTWKAARRCTGLRTDGFAIHPYNFARRPREARRRNPDIVEIGSLDRLHAALDKLRRRGALTVRSGSRASYIPVYLTEFGYFTEGPVAQTASTQARWMSEAWNIARRDRRVRQLLQYLIVDPWSDGVTWHTAVLNRDGSPRPVYHALAKLAR